MNLLCVQVLDDVQNSTFVDTYLGLPFDLSKAMFIGTANRLADIPSVLLDRMEVRYSTYSAISKRNHVLPLCALLLSARL